MALISKQQLHVLKGQLIRRNQLDDRIGREAFMGVVNLLDYYFRKVVIRLLPDDPTGPEDERHL